MEYYNMDMSLIQVQNLKEAYFFMGLIESIITGLFIIILLALYTIIGFIGLMVIQLVSYRVFKFNIYKKILRKFVEV
jgi:hypothetical protein